MFNLRIKIVLLVKERSFNKIIKDIFQYILIINLLKNNNNNINLISFINIIKFRFVILLVTHLIKLI